MNLYVYGIIALLLAAAFTADGVYFYNRGKDAGFHGILSGVATSQKKDDTETKVALAKAEELGKQLATLEAQKNDLVKKLKNSVAKDPRSTCIMSSDELRALQDAAGGT